MKKALITTFILCLCMRSMATRNQFRALTGYPHGRPGYVVDHIKALCCGGQDVITNMQWQTIAEAKKKDKTECLGCQGCKEPH